MGNNIKMLVIDDDAKICTMFGDILEDEPVDVECASDGADGIKKAASGNFDLILIDVVMPNIDGIQTLAKIREVNKDVKIIMMTGYSVEGKLQKAKEYNIDAVLKKPINTYEITKIIKEISESKSSQT